MGEAAISTLDYLAKYELRVTVLSIIFSLILTGLYYLFHHIRSLKDLKESTEKEVIQKYEEKLNRLNTELNASQNKIIELKEQITQMKDKEQELKEQINFLNSELSSLRLTSSIESFKEFIKQQMNTDNIKTYEKKE